MLRAGRMEAEIAGRTVPQELCLSIPRSACALALGRAARGSVYVSAVSESGGGEQPWDF